MIKSYMWVTYIFVARRMCTKKGSADDEIHMIERGRESRKENLPRKVIVWYVKRTYNL